MENEYFEYFDLEGSQGDKRSFSNELSDLKNRSTVFDGLMGDILAFARDFYPLSLMLVRGGHALPGDQKNLDKGQIQWVLDLDDLDALPKLGWDEKDGGWILPAGVPDWAIFREALIIHEVKRFYDYHFELEVNSKGGEDQLAHSHEAAIKTENDFRRECGQSIMREHRKMGRDPEHRWYLDDAHYVELTIDTNNNITAVQYQG